MCILYDKGKIMLMVKYAILKGIRLLLIMNWQYHTTSVFFIFLKMHISEFQLLIMMDQQ